MADVTIPEVDAPARQVLGVVAQQFVHLAVHDALGVEDLGHSLLGCNDEFHEKSRSWQFAKARDYHWSGSCLLGFRT